MAQTRHLPRLAKDRIGQDVEFFLWDTKEEKVVPAHKYFPKLEDSEELSSGRIFRDGLAVEVNTPPTNCKAFLWEDLKYLLRCPQGIPRHIRYTSRPYVEFSSQLKAHFPQDVRILGCHPTLDAYTERQKTIRVDPMKLNFRTSGAHLHMSFFKPKTFKKATLPAECWGPIIKLSDILLGLPFTHIFGDELEFKRRRLYGTAGEFRFQESYGGIEYRVLSSRLFNHPGIFGLFSGIWKYVIPLYPYLWPSWDKAWEPELQEAINTGRGTEKLLPLWDKLVNAMQKRLKYSSAPVSVSLNTWNKLREMNKAGMFPDAGVINNNFPNAHQGWFEYSEEWGLK